MGSEHFWKLRCWESARRWGAKHIWQSKFTKHLSLGALLEVAMLKKCTPLWREAHFEVKSGKTEGFGALLDVRMSFCVAGTRDSAVSKTWGFCSSFNYNHHYPPFHYPTTTTTLHYTTLITLHYTPLHLTTQHYTTLNYTTRHYDYNYNCNYGYNYNYNYSYNYNYITLHALHYTTLRYSTLHHTTPHHTTLITTTATTTTTLDYTTLDNTTRHYPTFHYTTLITPPQMQLQLHYTTYTTQLQLHYTTTTTTAALHRTTSSSCGWGDRPGDHCNHPTTFRSISGFALPSAIHNSQPLL